MFPTLATFRFVFPTLGPRGTPHPLLHTGLCLTNGSKDSLAMDCCTALFSALRGRFIDFSWYSHAFFLKKVESVYLLRFQFVSAIFHGDSFLGGGWRPCGPFPRWPPSPDRFPRWDPEGPPHPLHHTGIPHLQTGRWF